MVRIGIIGLGNMGSFHANLFQERKIKNAKLVAVCDIDPKRLVNYANIHTFTNPKKFIKSGLVDAIIIATPHYAHTTLGIEALEQGLHVLVEKPVSVHKADAERLYKTHKNKKQVFALMFNLRTVPHYQIIKKMVEKGELGEIQRTSWFITDIFRSEFYYASGTWRATWKGEGGGVLLNQAPHNLDLFQWICGMPSKVRAFCYLGKYHNIEVEDEVTAYLEYPNGATGIFVTSTGELPGTNRFEIAGDKGKILYENGKIIFTKNAILRKKYSKSSKDLFGKPKSIEKEIKVKGTGGQHAQIDQNFVDSISKGIPLMVPAREGIKSLELGNAMLYSSITGETVTLPLNEKKYESMLMNLIKKSSFRKKSHKTIAKDMNKSFTK